MTRGRPAEAGQRLRKVEVGRRTGGSRRPASPLRSCVPSSSTATAKKEISRPSLGSSRLPLPLPFGALNGSPIRAVGAELPVPPSAIGPDRSPRARRNVHRVGSRAAPAIPERHRRRYRADLGRSPWLDPDTRTMPRTVPAKPSVKAPYGNGSELPARSRGPTELLAAGWKPSLNDLPSRRRRISRLGRTTTSQRFGRGRNHRRAVPASATPDRTEHDRLPRTATTEFGVPAVARPAPARSSCWALHIVMCCLSLIFVAAFYPARVYVMFDKTPPFPGRAQASRRSRPYAALFIFSPVQLRLFPSEFIFTP